METFETVINGWRALAIVAKLSILDMYVLLYLHKSYRI